MTLRYPDAAGADDLADDHDCDWNNCTPEQHYGTNSSGLCIVCSGCGDPECCTHGPECFSPEWRD